MSKISRDLAPPPTGLATLHPRESIVATGTLASLNATIEMPADGVSAVSVDVRGTYVGTFALEGTVDGGNWVAVPLRPLNQASLLYFITAASAAQGVFIGKAAGFRSLRLRMVAWTSGAPDVVLLGSTGPFEDPMAGLTTNTLGTIQNAAGVITTLSLASPGPGLRLYLTYLSINRYAAAALTAAAVPVVVTTTNLPGSLAFTFAADALPQGALDRWREDFAYPLAAVAQATAVTIVCPATPNVIWRITAGGYVAP